MGSESGVDLVQKRYTVIADLERGDSVETVAGYLVNEGWNEQEALAFVNGVREQEAAREPIVSDQEFRDRETELVSRRNMTNGVVIFCVGVLAAVLTHARAVVTGQYIGYGTILVGTVRFCVAYSALRRLRKRHAEAQKLEV